MSIRPGKTIDPSRSGPSAAGRLPPGSTADPAARDDGGHVRFLFARKTPASIGTADERCGVSKAGCSSCNRARSQILAGFTPAKRIGRLLAMQRDGPYRSMFTRRIKWHCTGFLADKLSNEAFELRCLPA